MKKIFVSAIVALALSATAASAATLTLFGGDTGNAVPFNFGPLRDVNGPVATPTNLEAPVTIFDEDDGAGSGLVVSGAEMVRVTLTYLGYEAGNTNSGASKLSIFGDGFFQNTVSVTGDQVSFTQAAGTGTLVSLFFETLGEITEPCTIDNGGSLGSTCQIAFSSIFNNGMSTYAMFGDGLGDSDLDDLVFRVDVAAVPLPASALLLLAGLGGLGAVARRKKA